MANQFIILILLHNVIIFGFVTAYRSNTRYDYSEPRQERKFRLRQPTGDLNNNVYINPNDLEKLSQQEKFNSELENWTGKWFPNNDQTITPASTIDDEVNSIDIHHSVSMGSENPDCDDGKRKLNVDWDNSPADYTCYGLKVTPSYSIHPMWYCEYVPPYYKAIHRCMNQTIEYEEAIPTYGTHRPVWPVYGEYKFLPRQRWLHSLEHGAIVMLYHPCANPLEVQRLKDLVTKCLRRHVITHYNQLEINRPLALIAWGCRLTMSYVDEEFVTRFIKKRALHGKEDIADDGEFSEGLLTMAQIVSDKNDSQLCPRHQ
ncbi:hypothetical protein PV325_005666 [Microctonus aethiopoides]|uniref:Tumor protein p53-inducible protein 13 n=1 Tax=Microctonus aethiopoides TaxID=144406 RepID=A0AA39FK70_9HYME|nr:hypothetical protein PV325_005666 [Microctonus aethiopoides]KAK0093449.1 hypothetical protein PV326_013488 [Microctonus aethiopoides]KAK0171112.1 hypothetical protein PV328_008870 [Microctonus aethiopoides]